MYVGFEQLVGVTLYLTGTNILFLCNMGEFFFCSACSLSFPSRIRIGKKIKQHEIVQDRKRNREVTRAGRHPESLPAKKNKKTRRVGEFRCRSLLSISRKKSIGRVTIITIITTTIIFALRGYSVDDAVSM